MKLGIIGLPGSGRSTIFEALTRKALAETRKSENRIASVSVPDPRVDALVKMYSPKKVTYAKVEYLLPALEPADREKMEEKDIWNYVRNCDALIHIVRNFNGGGSSPARPAEDFLKLDREMIFADFMTVEKKVQRLESDRSKNKKIDDQEYALLKSCMETMEKDAPLRARPELASAGKLKGYALMSAKPLLLVFNNDEGDACAPELNGAVQAAGREVVRGKLEAELAGMQDEDADELQAGFGISQSAMDRVIQRSYELLGLISFFTVGEDEVRAWTVRKDSPAPDAAEAIHSDIKKGFIRAEVVSYDHLIRCGSEQEAKRKGLYRLEGKTYIVQDGDIICFRFNV